MERGEEFLRCFRGIPGVDPVFLLDEADRFKLLEIEPGAEKKSFLGLGKAYNSGIREIIACPVVILGFTSKAFSWGCESHILLKKDDRVVGEEIWDPNKIRELESLPDIWFLHRNFVVYKSRVDFPRDVVEQRCCFELPAVLFEQELEGMPPDCECIVCYPSTRGDVFLKETYLAGKGERGTGTALFGIRNLDL